MFQFIAPKKLPAIAPFTVKVFMLVNNFFFLLIRFLMLISFHYITEAKAKKIPLNWYHSRAQRGEVVARRKAATNKQGKKRAAKDFNERAKKKIPVAEKNQLERRMISHKKLMLQDLKCHARKMFIFLPSSSLQGWFFNCFLKGKQRRGSLKEDSILRAFKSLL